MSESETKSPYKVQVLDRAFAILDVLATGRDLETHEFQCGDHPFLYEFLAPFGHCWAVARGLRRMSVFKGRRIPCLRGEATDGARRIPRVKYFQF